MNYTEPTQLSPREREQAREASERSRRERVETFIGTCHALAAQIVSDAPAFLMHRARVIAEAANRALSPEQAAEVDAAIASSIGIEFTATITRELAALSSWLPLAEYLRGHAFGAGRPAQAKGLDAATEAALADLVRRPYGLPLRPLPLGSSVNLSHSLLASENWPTVLAPRTERRVVRDALPYTAADRREGAPLRFGPDRLVEDTVIGRHPMGELFRAVAAAASDLDPRDLTPGG